MKPSRESVPTPEDFLDDYPERIRSTANALRTLIRDMLPAATERVYPGWKAIGYRDPEVGYLCGIFPRREHVRLLFEHGASLRDPDGLFDGGGAQTRFLTIPGPEAIPEAGIRRLILAALHEAALRGSGRP